MKTKIKFPDIPYNRREYFVNQRCAYLGDCEVHKAVIEGRFVFAWDGELMSAGIHSTPTLGVLESVCMNSDGSRTYTITSENNIEGIGYKNAVVLREEWCPEVALVDKFGNRYLRRWIGLQERDGKILAVVSNDDADTSASVDPSTLILLDNSKVGLPEREEA
jgi:hypothetical protein